MESEDLDVSSDSDQECLPSSHLIEQLASVDERMKLYPSYDLHLEKVTLLKDMQDDLRLLQAYEDFSKAFPLTTELWLIWIHRAIEKEDTEDEVLQLFARAVKDYLGVQIWVSYIDYAALSLNDEMKDEDWVRKIYEEALSLPAFHVKEGIHIWKTAINIEKRFYNSYKDEDEGADNQMKLKKQLGKVVELYHRMFSLPLIGMTEEFDEFKAWIAEDEIKVANIEDITESFNNAEKKLAAVMPHEKKLERCSETDIFKYEVFPKYIDFIKNHLEASTAQIACLYERMIELFPIEPSVWIRYLEFLKSNDSSKVFCAAERSVRNCPYSGDLRVEHAKAVEQNSDDKTIKELYRTAMEIPYEDPLQLILVWKNYNNFLVKLHSEGTDCSIEMEELFRTTSKVINKYFYNHKSNVRTQFLMEWAEVRTNIFNDLDSAREIWNTTILVKNDKSSGKLWGRYLDFEQKYGTLETVREAFSKAMALVYHGAEQISEKWLEFEKKNGSTEQLSEAIRRCESRLQNMGVADQNHSDADDIRTNKSQKQTSKNSFQPRAITIKPNPHNKPPKRKMNSKKEEDHNPEADSEAKKTVQENKQKIPPKEVKPTNTYTPSSVDAHRTVFLSNLDFTVTEDEIKSIFEKAVGPIESVRLKTDFKGRSKGFGYIVYQSKDSVDIALKMDHTMIKGRPSFVSNFNSDKNTRKHFFAYSNSQEKNKLFIRGLNFDTTKETLKELFSKYGTVKDVRLVTFRNGRPKGLAYVDFETEVMASKAVEATNGTELDSRKIFVAISQPSVGSEKLPAEEPLDRLIRKSNTRLMIPTNVKLPIKKPKLDLDAIISETQRGNTSTNETTNASSTDIKTIPEKSAKLSNADFRNMLLQKK